MATGGIRAGADTSPHARIVLLRRLKVALFAAVVVPSLLFVGGAWDERVQRLRAAEADALATVTALREHALKALETHELLVRELDRRIQGMSWDDIHASAATLSAEFAAMRSGMPEISAMAIVDANGLRQAGIGPQRRDGHVLLSNREYWYAQRDADRGTFISQAYVGALSGRMDFAISRRRTTPDGSFDGTVHVSVTAAYFSDFWSAVVADRKDVMIELVRSDGEVLAHLPEPGGILPPLNGQDSPLMQQIETDPQGNVFRARSATDGVDRIYAYSRVGNYPLVVGYCVTVRSVVTPWRQHVLELGGVGVLATAALVIAVLAIMQQVQRLIAEQARRVAIEQGVHEGQRLKLLGQFAAGVAHDFANILQAMEVVATLLRRAAGQPERVRSLADRLAEDVQRGASLTERMLDLVRHNGAPDKGRENEPIKVIDPVAAMSRVSEMLPRFLGRKYRLRCELVDDLPASMRGDLAEFELAVMNLAVNARDAMPNGGEICIQVASERVGEAFGDLGGVHHRVVLLPGPYVRISVSDKGVGMSPEVLAHAGELFFTTKPQGRGTGLGLAGARGFAERAGGNLSIESEEGHGTTVTIWLPAIERCPAPGPRPVEQVG